MDLNEKVLQLVRIKGPVVPSNISSEINMNILLASAVLSEMVSKNILRISSVKIGGSPLYYLPGQEHRLQDYASKLHEKERRAYDLLREKKVLRDTALDPLTRVALRQIKDFAKPLEVTFGEESELFWKWYLVSTEDAEPLIKSQIGKPEEAKESAQETLVKKLPTEKKEVRHLDSKVDDSFVNRLLDYFGKNNIRVLEQSISKRRTEIDFVLAVPSAVGELRYYCRAKNKKTSNDSDLSAAFVQGQMKKLPVLFLTTGEITKKAKELLDKEFAGITVKQV